MAFRIGVPKVHMPGPATSLGSLNSALYSVHRMGGVLRATNCWEAGSRRGQQVPAARVPGRAQMEWLWAGGKGQMQPPLEPQLPRYLFIVSLSPQPTRLLPPRLPFCHLLVAPLIQQPRPQDSSGSPREGPPQVSLLWGPWSGQEGGRSAGEAGMGAVRQSINHAPLRSCLTHTSPPSCQ